MNKISVTKILVIVIVVLAAGYLIIRVAPDFFAGENRRSQKFLSNVAAEINRSLPVMIDRETELLLTAGAEGVLIYNYRLVNFSAAQLDPKKFATAAKQQVTQGACATAETREGYLKKGITLRYSYYDKEKQHIATVDVRPSDCGF
ncbi:MAG TPA: hypothetical protein VFM35_07505 [Candidatus Binatia bacterium]|nr:hypothetical protein [Candidatus Binatia bacterium]